MSTVPQAHLFLITSLPSEHPDLQPVDNIITSKGKGFLITRFLLAILCRIWNFYKRKKTYCCIVLHCIGNMTYITIVLLMATSSIYLWNLRKQVSGFRLVLETSWLSFFSLGTKCWTCLALFLLLRSVNVLVRNQILCQCLFIQSLHFVTGLTW